MIYLTEQQRLEAIEICDRIEALNAKMQAQCAGILQTLDRLSNPQTAVGDRESQPTSTERA